MSKLQQKKSKIDKSHKKLKRDIKYLVPAFLVLIVSVFISLNIGVKNSHAEEIVVYKSPTCGCCKKWVSHLKKSGFDVVAKDYNDMNPIKKRFGVKRKFQSCHTAKVGKYFIEGHVSASDIKRLLKEKPDIKGLSAPGMPMGSPGMEGHRKDKYNVIAIDKNNNATVYSQH